MTKIIIGPPSPPSHIISALEIIILNHTRNFVKYVLSERFLSTLYWPHIKYNSLFKKQFFKYAKHWLIHRVGMVKHVVDTPETFNNHMKLFWVHSSSRVTVKSHYYCSCGCGLITWFSAHSYQIHFSLGWPYLSWWSPNEPWAVVLLFPEMQVTVIYLVIYIIPSPYGTSWNLKVGCSLSCFWCLCQKLSLFYTLMTLPHKHTHKLSFYKVYCCLAK